MFYEETISHINRLLESAVLIFGLSYIPLSIPGFRLLHQYFVLGVIFFFKIKSRWFVLDSESFAMMLDLQIFAFMIVNVWFIF